MYAALKKVSLLPNGYHWENNFQDDREYSLDTCTSDILSPSSAPNLLVHFFTPKIKKNLTNSDVPCTMNCLNFIYEKL